MTATNHALTGAIIGTLVVNPVLAVILAVLSHFVLDGIPHYDSEGRVVTKAFDKYLIIDALLCISLVVLLYINSPQYWFLPAVCAFVAVSPDFMWSKAYMDSKREHNFVKPKHLLARIHAKVQWFQRPIGWVVEVCWLLGAAYILAKII